MKKLLIATLILVMTSAIAVKAADDSTYTGQFINKYTQKVTDKEKQLQQQKKANEEARAKQKKELQKKIEADKKARENAAKARQQKIDQKKKQWNDLISK